MIAKSILVCLGWLVGYSALLMFVPDLSASQALWQENLQQAEHYLYDDGRPQAVVVGSSMAARLMRERMSGYENLSFAGLSVFEGLALLHYKDTLPLDVYIETNSLLRKPDETFRATLLSPIRYPLQRYVPAFRADKHPLAIVGHSLGEAMHDEGRWVKAQLLGLPAVASGMSSESPEPPPLDERMLDVQIKQYAERPTEKLLSAQLQLLADEVSYLQSRGVRITFFEMPTNPRLTHLPFAQLIRVGVHNAFPDARFRHIELPPDSPSYVTTDGIHLTPPEAARYTDYFVEHGSLRSASK